eukprot:59755_1
MKFGKTLKQEKEYMASWSGHFMSYSALKKLISVFAKIPDEEKNDDYQTVSADRSPDAVRGQFFETLGKDIHGVQRFYEHILRALTENFLKFQRKLEGMNEMNRDEKKKLAKAIDAKAQLKKVYELMYLLDHYCELNRTGFRKIVKKWDKNTNESNLEEFLIRVDSNSFASHEELAERILEVECLYAEFFEDGNLDSAQEDLAYLKVHVRLATGKDKGGVLGLVGVLVGMFKESMKKRKSGH